MSLQAPAAYYKISLDPSPCIIRVRSNRKARYRYRYSGADARVFEINYIQEGNLCEMREDGEHIYEQGTVHTLVNNRQFTQYSTAPVLHEYYLSHMLAAPAEPITEEEVASWKADGSEAILPEYITDPVLCNQLGMLIKSTMGIHASADPLRGLKLRACMYECLSLISEFAVNQARSRTKKDRPISRYTEKACRYITTHLREKFTVNDVAQASGISYNHLKNLFQRDMKLSIMEYANRQRIGSVEQLITAGGMTLEQAGELVGISDPTYLSRLFRRCTGMSIREYRRIYNEKLELGTAP